MLVHTALSTQTLSSHGWNNPQTVSHQPLPPLWNKMRTPSAERQRYATTTTSPSSSTTTTRLQLYTGEGNEINIDDVLMEAEFALQAAETSLSNPTTEAEEEGSSELQMLARSVDALAGTMGGIVLGGLLGTIIFSQVPDLDLLISPIILPILFSFVLGTLGFASGFVTTPTATAIQSVLANPTKAILSSLGLLALQQVEKGAEEVKAIPSKMASEVKSIPSKMASNINQTVEQVSNDIQAMPSKMVTATKDKVSDIQVEAMETLEKNRNVLVGTTLVAISVPVVYYVMNSEQLGGMILN